MRVWLASLLLVCCRAPDTRVAYDDTTAAAACSPSWGQLRPTLFHELHHLVRDAAIDRRSLMDAVVSEGFATAFERDFAGVDVPWAHYPPEVKGWVKELLALPDTTRRSEWLYLHPDGRRWVGLRAGTYLADRAMRATKKTSADLVTMPTAEIVRLGLEGPSRGARGRGGA